MTKEERRQYDKEYRREGFGKINDARYRAAHREEFNRKARERMRAKRKHRRDAERGTTAS